MEEIKEIICRVHDYMQWFFLPNETGARVKGGSVVKLHPLVAEEQIKAGTVYPISAAQADMLKTELATPENKALIKAQSEINKLRSQNKILERKRTTDDENTSLKVQLTEIREQQAKKDKLMEELLEHNKALMEFLKKKEEVKEEKIKIKTVKNKKK